MLNEPKVYSLSQPDVAVSVAKLFKQRLLYCTTCRNVRRILVREVNSSLPSEAKKILTI